MKFKLIQNKTMHRKYFMNTFSKNTGYFYFYTLNFTCVTVTDLSFSSTETGCWGGGIAHREKQGVRHGGEWSIVAVVEPQPHPEACRWSWPRDKWRASHRHLRWVRFAVGLPRLQPGSLLRVPAPCSVSCSRANASELTVENVGDVRLPTGLAKVRQEGLG